MNAVLSRIVMAIFAITQSSVALADAATHRLSLTSYDTVSDCIGRNCTPTCVINASLVSERHASPELAVAFRYKNGADRDQLYSYFTFDFPPMERSSASGVVTDHVLGVACRKISVDKVDVTCPQARDRCPIFLLVAIPETAAPHVSAQKVEAK